MSPIGVRHREAASGDVHGPPLSNAERAEAAVARKMLLVERLRKIAPEHALHATDAVRPDHHGIARLRRQRCRATDDPLAAIELVDVGHTLLWQPAQTGLPELARRRAGLSGYANASDDSGAVPRLRRQVLARFLFERRHGRALSDYIAEQDARSFGDQKFSRWDGSWDGKGWCKWDPKHADFPSGARVLLVVPGAFASATSIFAQLERTSCGREFLRAALQQYAAVLAFAPSVLHATPAMSGLALAKNLWQNRDVGFDVIAHGSGGLVVRWWLDAYGGADRHGPRAVMVGAPLGGTTLAQAANMLWAPSVMTCMSAGLLERVTSEQAQADQRDPTAFDKAADRLLHLSIVLLTVGASVTELGSATAQFEPAAAMLPGWLAQAGNDASAEAAALASLPCTAPNTFRAVTARFRAGGAEWQPAAELTGAASEPDTIDHHALVHPPARGSIVASSSDLLVDTRAMTALGPRTLVAPGLTLAFTDPASAVHHLNYFEQDATVSFLRRAFGMSGDGSAH